MYNNVAQKTQTRDAHFAMRMPQTMLANLRKVAVADGRTASAMALRFIAAGIIKAQEAEVNR